MLMVNAPQIVPRLFTAIFPRNFETKQKPCAHTAVWASEVKTLDCSLPFLGFGGRGFN
ncbi:hypothetical protein DPMN_144930 [Dreissena polymorpha]|uniref:Uncharacterized protein n=1 Tax=Dreissena polymorpha TaxID=45954 RepID=A0A9D4F512_DREPO|nr:hypothetical protein DPMN_144930 [Dreissena polymorpha]